MWSSMPNLSSVGPTVWPPIENTHARTQSPLLYRWLPFYLTNWSHWSLHFLSWWCMESSSCFFGLHIIIAATPPSIVLPRSGPRSMTLGIVKNAVRDDVNIRRKISKMFRQNFARLLARELLLLLTPSKIDPAERLLVCCLIFTF